MAKPNNLFKMHPVEQKIIYNLSRSGGMKFNEIKNFEIDPKNFVYHLKKLIYLKLVEYDAASLKYSLSLDGKKYFSQIRVRSNLFFPVIDTFIGLFIELRDKILVVEREIEPYLGHVGIPVFDAYTDEFISNSAKKHFSTIGLTGTLENKLMLETIFKDGDGNALTHTNFYIFNSQNPSGDIPEEIDEGKLLWISKDEFTKQKKGYNDSKVMFDFFCNNKSSGQTSDIKIISRIDKKSGF